MFVVSMKANRGILVAVGAIGVALAMLLTRCGGTAVTSNTVVTDQEATPTQGETNGTTGQTVVFPGHTDPQ